MKLYRLRIRDFSKEMCVYDTFDGVSIDVAIERLMNLRDTYEKRIIEEDLLVNFEVEENGWDGGVGMTIVGYRWETDKELEKRQARYDTEQEKQEKKRLARERRLVTMEKKKAAKAAVIEAEERAEYERLRAKFGD